MSSKEKKKGIFGKKFGKASKKGEEGSEDAAAASKQTDDTTKITKTKPKKPDKDESSSDGGRSGRGRDRDDDHASSAASSSSVKGKKSKDEDGKPNMFQRVRERSRSRSRSRKDSQGLSDSTRKDMLVAVTSCRSDGYYNQKAPGTISKLPRKAPTNLKLFHELAIGVKDAYAAVGETPQKPNPDENGDMGREELAARTVLWDFIGNLDFVSI